MRRIWFGLQLLIAVVICLVASGVALAGGAQLLLGHIYYSERRFEDAQRAFEQYLKDVPSASNASQVTKLIADLKATPRN
jgi:outer membrane protein assembly factor BamD (BamD/ComL family)